MRRSWRPPCEDLLVPLTDFDDVWLDCFGIPYRSQDIRVKRAVMRRMRHGLTPRATAETYPSPEACAGSLPGTLPVDARSARPDP